MSLVIFNSYISIGNALVTFSALEAGGFHPSFHNYHHAHIAYLQMMAFGGLIIQLPECEIEDAKAWITHLQNTRPLETDPLPMRKYGMWKRASVFAFLSTGIFLPIFILPLILLGAVIIGLYLLGIFTSQGYFYAMFGLGVFYFIMMLHANYIALPRLKNSHKDGLG